MKRRAFILGGVGLAASGSVLLGTGAVSETDSQRTVTVEAVGDDDAPLRLAYQDHVVECGEHIDLVELTNHLETEITDLDFAARSSPGPSVLVLDAPDSLAVGEHAAVTAEVECDTDERATTRVSFDIDAVGADLSISVSREVRVNCRCPAEDDPPPDGRPGNGTGSPPGQGGNGVAGDDSSADGRDDEGESDN